MFVEFVPPAAFSYNIIRNAVKRPCDKLNDIEAISGSSFRYITDIVNAIPTKHLEESVPGNSSDIRKNILHNEANQFGCLKTVVSLVFIRRFLVAFYKTFDLAEEILLEQDAGCTVAGGECGIEPLADNEYCYKNRGNKKEDWGSFVHDRVHHGVEIRMVLRIMPIALIISVRCRLHY
ncbi:MAG: hypothetical protein E7554_01445 [Ruminococcaceae bacterium]|nr:hypothetical protein [Oscillospiraceae bacterium]